MKTTDAALADTRNKPRRFNNNQYQILSQRPAPAGRKKKPMSWKLYMLLANKL